jgi:hypothetical protein
MFDISLDTLTKYIIQNNPIEVKNNLMRMRLVGDDFDMTHDNFKALLASLPQSPDYLTEVTANALDVLVDGQRAGVNYLRALQSTTGLGLGQLVHSVASPIFQAASQIASQSGAAADKVAETTQRKFSTALTIQKNKSDDMPQLTPLGWVLTILVVLALVGGLWALVSGISRKIKKI